MSPVKASAPPAPGQRTGSRGGVAPRPTLRQGKGYAGERGRHRRRTRRGEVVTDDPTALPRAEEFEASDGITLKVDPRNRSDADQPEGRSPDRGDTRPPEPVRIG
ncbi:hypothetical protein [Sinomonas sp. ASV322]|uniref:hypothetical protein n=1 Tax=Sinomonas sp. ASV322 TaxID=3041920 RepID=UPI0027DC2F29|nr:hypothetical protein [Sinomonas sp. ASV322]MDQ4500817.1 hypothetical protein [Sinomonas sp. ASV322]